MAIAGAPLFLSRRAPVTVRICVWIMVALGTMACGTTLPLESYQEAPAVVYPTEEIFTAAREEVWQAVLEVLGENRVPIELANEATGSLATGWAEGTSLIWQRRRLGDRSEAGGLPLPVRYRFDVTVNETDVGVTVSVFGNEETNFLILTGVDPETGLGYYRDDWRRTPTRTAREHEFLVALRRRLQDRQDWSGDASRVHDRPILLRPL